MCNGALLLQTFGEFSRYRRGRRDGRVPYHGGGYGYSGRGRGGRNQNQNQNATNDY